MIPVSPFTGQHVPDILWPDLIAEFGVDIEYHAIDQSGESVATIQGLLLEGVEGEFAAVGRYAWCVIDNRDLIRPPQAADWIDLNGVAYDIESVRATQMNISRCVVKQSGQTWLRR